MVKAKKTAPRYQIELRCPSPERWEWFWTIYRLPELDEGLIADKEEVRSGSRGYPSTITCSYDANKAFMVLERQDKHGAIL